MSRRYRPRPATRPPTRYAAEPCPVCQTPARPFAIRATFTAAWFACRACSHTWECHYPAGLRPASTMGAWGFTLTATDLRALAAHIELGRPLPRDLAYAIVLYARTLTSAPTPATASTTEAAQVLGCSVEAVRARLRRDTLAGWRDGPVWRVRLDGLRR